MATFSNILGAKKGEKGLSNYFCEYCHYTCNTKYKNDRHLLTSKHIQATNSNGLATEKGQKGQKVILHICENCNKEYNDRSGLWRHKKKCNYKESESEEDNNKSVEPSDKEIIMMLIKDNSEFKNMMMKVMENGTHNITNTNNISNNNKAFNLQFFLNETCKDAMNIMDFVESIKLQLSDLERVGELGYVEGISNIIIKNLKELDISQRPVHCTDKKREIMYIKDENKWEKDEEQTKMHKVVRNIAAKNARLVLKYKELHPDCNTYQSKLSKKYNKIIIEAMGGSGDNDFEKEEKIIRNISKQIGIVKE